jgi:membrane-associated phospholipid phosphatase
MRYPAEDTLILAAVPAFLFVIVTFQRFRSGAHTGKEIMAGYAAGILPVLVLLYLDPDVISQS